ncbi:MAG TPA: exo-alpha-sialidase, partial [Candidatus Sulfotelmatobacter sp.]|nr:exo-alpha-sialidase [Candidatus Sulfotelmatobacter sp.]
SADTGRNWTYLSSVAEAGRTLDNGELVALPNGHLLLAMRSLIEGVSYRLPVYRSTDGGQSWSNLSNIDSSEGLGSKGLWEPDFWVLGDGRLIVTYSNEKHSGYSQLISERVSLDNGATWGSELWAVYQVGGGALRPGMSQMARMANGKYILVYETVGLGNADVYYKVSDDGVNWSNDLGTHIPCQHCGPFVTALADGRVFVSSCENQLSFSEDFGATWQKIDPPGWNIGYNFSWPAAYATRTNELGLMVSWGGVKLRFGALSPPRLWPNPFFETFDTGADLNWTRYGGNVAFSNGRYLLNNTNSYGKALAGDSFWSDGTLEADVLVATPGNAGLMFRTTNPDYTGPDDAFGYYVGLDTGGFVVLGKMNNAWQSLATAPMAVPTNTWHHVKVTMQGSVLGIYVDDMSRAKLTWSDSSFRRGQIGVRAFQCNAQFDNVSFTNAVPLRLNLQRSTSQLFFSWPESAFNLRLCTTADLQEPVAWVPVTNAGMLANGQWSLSLATPAAVRQFYHLHPQ